MKKWLKILLILICFLIFCLVLFLTFRKITPVDDTKRLFISCENINNSYDVITGTEIIFSDNNEKCNLNLEIRNVDRTFVKIKSDVYLYGVDSNGNINNDSLFNDIYVTPDEKLILFALDKSTKIEFEYK